MRTLPLQRSRVWLEDGCGRKGKSIAELALSDTLGDSDIIFPFTVEPRYRACSFPVHHSEP